MPPTKKKTPRSKTTLTDSDLGSVLSLAHGDPHSVLGIHPEKQGLRVRVFRPEAESVSIILGGSDKPILCEKCDPAGLLEILMPGEKKAVPYQVRVEYPGRKIFTYWDPYAFWPTLGEMDLYLLGEGSHQKLHEKMGAHFIRHQDIEGVSFAVWAPGAKGVSVVGDFNGWDGRLHPMRRMGVSGIWEIFIPEILEGMNYKFEIRTHDGKRLLKADPYACATEKPPLTASVVHKTRYRFKDEEWMERRGQGDILRKPLSVYELHLESWKQVPEEGNRPLTYREMALELGHYIQELG